MAVHDFKAQRLFCDVALHEGAEIDCEPQQANYLLNVLRLSAGDEILIFNGRGGEWRSTISVPKKRTCRLTVSARVREQVAGPDIEYWFAPLKRARLDYMVQKATELGVAKLCPVYTRHTVAERVNLDRMRANVIEAAEQCGILRVPDVAPPQKLEQALSDWDHRRHLIFADEGAEITSPVEALQRVKQGPCAVLIGPEGGFSSQERDTLLGLDFVVRLSLGPRIMRADTAAVATLTLVNAVLGDWR